MRPHILNISDCAVPSEKHMNYSPNTQCDLILGDNQPNGEATPYIFYRNYMHVQISLQTWYSYYKR